MDKILTINGITYFSEEYVKELIFENINKALWSGMVNQPAPKGEEEKPKKAMTEEEMIAEDYKNGITIVQLMKKYHKTNRTIGKILDSYGYKNRRCKTNKSEEPKTETDTRDTSYAEWYKNIHTAIRLISKKTGKRPGLVLIELKNVLDSKYGICFDQIKTDYKKLTGTTDYVPAERILYWYENNNSACKDLTLSILQNMVDNKE